MRDQWYADNRDLVKWGVLLTLADRFHAKHILQVLYYRATEWAPLEINGENVKLPKAVVQHFRRVGAISTIQASVPVEVVLDTFTDRVEYHDVVINRLRSRERFPGIVFLDPDTGLEPGAAGLEHVLEAELAKLWHELQYGDVLVFYQHQTNRNGAPWIEKKKGQFERALGVPTGDAKIARAEKIARDVVFFYVQKVGQPSAV